MLSGPYATARQQKVSLHDHLPIRYQHVPIFANNSWYNIGKLMRKKPKQVWSKRYFHHVHEPKPSSFPNPVLYNKVTEDRKTIHDWYTEELQEHIRAAAEVTGMIVITSNGNPVKVTNDQGVCQSLRKDGSEANVKRACFIFHYSPNNAYTIFSTSSLVHKLETEFMDRLGIEYQQIEEERFLKGCVSQFGNKIWNNITTNTKTKVGNKNVKFNQRQQRGSGAANKNGYTSSRGANFKYRIKTIEDLDERMVSLCSIL